jgi:parallel beta-helix repeat protein
VRLNDHDMEVDARVSRRAVLGRAGATAVGAGAAAAVIGIDSARAAAGLALFIVVDPAGGGDYTNVETAVAQAPAGAYVYVVPGTYTIQLGDMDPQDGVRVSGAGYGTLLRAKNALNTNIFTPRHDHVVIQNLRIDGNAPNQSSAVNGIAFNSQHGEVSNCWVHDARGYNIVGFGGAHWMIRGNHSYATGVSPDYPSEGIELHGPNHCSVVGNTVIGARNNGILLWNSSGDCHHNTVVGNTVRDCGVSGIELEDGAHDNTITGNTCENNHWGIWINQNGNSGPPRANTVTGNTVTKSLQHGIMLIGIAEATIADNIVAENLAHGIRLVASKAVTVTGNTASRNLRSGISLEDTSDCVVSANVCSSNGRDRDFGTQRSGIILQQSSSPTSRNVVSDNRCVDTQATKTQLYGIALTGTPAANLIGPNLLDGNATSGMLVPAAAAGKNDSVPFRKLKATIADTQTSVPHGLPYVPQSVTVLKTSPGDVWQSAAPDATNVYLRADAAGRTVEILAG